MKKSSSIIFKVLGITSLLVLVAFIGIVVFAMVIFGSNEKTINSKELVKSTEFKELHELITVQDSIKNISVLPEENYIVINGTVINLSKRTFGKEPALGFYHSYYSEGDKKSYNSLDSLLTARRIGVDSLIAFTLIEKMKTVGISDVAIYPEGLTYRWKVSAMYGEEGIFYTNEEIHKDSIHVDLLENIETGFYHYAIYK